MSFLYRFFHLYHPQKRSDEAFKHQNYAPNFNSGTFTILDDHL